MNQELPSLVLASMRCGVITVDGGGRVTALNGAAAACLGIDPRDTLGRHCLEVFAGCAPVGLLLQGALEQETLPDRAEFDLDLGRGRTLIGFTLSRITGPDGELLGCAMFFKDLTPVEEALEKEALQSRLASLGQVAAQLAHELRNLLGGVRLFLGLGRRRLLDDPEGCGYLDRAEQEIVTASEKLSEVLEFVRPVDMTLLPADLSEVCRQALDATLARFPEAGVEVRWDCDPAVPPVLVDVPRVCDALANLFANAVEAMEGSGRIGIRIRAEEAPVLVASPRSVIPGLRGYGESTRTRVRLEISDNGPGMPPEVQSRIFHPFFTTKETGSGLGVPAAQKIVSAHGGSLDVRSAPDRGTTFTVLLPAGEGTHG